MWVFYAPKRLVLDLQTYVFYYKIVYLKEIIVGLEFPFVSCVQNSFNTNLSEVFIADTFVIQMFFVFGLLT